MLVVSESWERAPRCCEAPRSFLGASLVLPTQSIQRVVRRVGLRGLEPGSAEHGREPDEVGGPQGSDERRERAHEHHRGDDDQDAPHGRTAGVVGTQAPVSLGGAFGVIGRTGVGSATVCAQAAHASVTRIAAARRKVA